jgi:hypothetical protein
MREGCHRVRRGQQLGLGGFGSALLKAREEAPVNDYGTIAYRHPSPIIFDSAAGFDPCSPRRRILRRQPTTHSYVGVDISNTITNKVGQTLSKGIRNIRDIS